MSALVELPGEPVSPAALRIVRAAAFARYVTNEENHAFDLVQCYCGPGWERVSVLVRPEVPQRPKYDIRDEEPLTVTFDGEGRFLPEVLALRQDFPEVPHLNLRTHEIPKSLCLFAERPEEINLRWTPALLGERILWWFKETALGTLHGDDQALEPFLGGVLRPLILPPDLFSTADSEILLVYRAEGGASGEVLIAARAGDVPDGLSAPEFTLLPFELPKQVHGVIRREPQTLLDLQDLCQTAGMDLFAGLRQRFKDSIGSVQDMSKGTILVIAVPKARHSDGPVERTDIYGFRCRVASARGAHDIGLGKLGEFLGVLGSAQAIAGGESRYVPLLNTVDIMSVAAADVAVEMLRPELVLTREAAAALSGRDPSRVIRIFAVGQGALGSQVSGNLVRQGYGQWDLIDEDYIAPHNPLRHAILGRRFGLSKALEMARLANATFAGTPIAHGVAANILASEGKTQDLAGMAEQADIILDMSASVAVARHLALDTKSDATRIAAFLNPSGSDLVVMSEGANRRVPLDSLEAQYLRALVHDAKLENHLAGGEGRVRYGGSCRDLTARISQEAVALHAAIGAAAVREAIDTESATLSIWQYEPTAIAVQRQDIAIEAPIVLTAMEWTVVTDEGLRRKVMGYRSTALPNETCGVLLGYLDTQRRRIYVVDALPNPDGSVEQPNGCERGITGLVDAVSSISDQTLGQVDYIGEWHSHPDDTACAPSERDERQMDWVTAKMHPEGKPAIMLIVCEVGRLCIFLGET